MAKKRISAAPKRPPWRPPSWDDPEKMSAAIDQYFCECDTTLIHKQHVTGKGDIVIVPTPTPYTMAGLALALRISRETLNQYRSENHPCYKTEPKKAAQFSDIISCARERIHHQNVTLAMVGCHDSRIAALNLASNYGYAAKKDIEHSVSDGLTSLLRDIAQSGPPKPAGDDE